MMMVFAWLAHRPSYKLSGRLRVHLSNARVTDAHQPYSYLFLAATCCRLNPQATKWESQPLSIFLHPVYNALGAPFLAPRTTICGAKQSQPGTRSRSVATPKESSSCLSSSAFAFAKLSFWRYIVDYHHTTTLPSITCQRIQFWHYRTTAIPIQLFLALQFSFIIIILSPVFEECTTHQQLIPLPSPTVWSIPKRPTARGDEVDIFNRNCEFANQFPGGRSTKGSGTRQQRQRQHSPDSSALVLGEYNSNPPWTVTRLTK